MLFEPPVALTFFRSCQKRSFRVSVASRVDAPRATTVIALPPSLALLVRRRAQRLERSVAALLDQMVAAFATLPPRERAQLLYDYRWSGAQAAPWVLLPTYQETRSLAGQIALRAWSVTEIYVAALAWQLAL